MHAIISSPQDLGRLVRRLREANELSQRKFDRRLGTSQRYSYELENAQPKTADARHFELLGLLGITLTADS